MKFMPIHGKRGLVALACVDSADFPSVVRHRWCLVNGYAMATVGLRPTLMHHLIVGHRAGHDVDHINGNRIDNPRANLRFATPAENARNKGISTANHTGFKGVSVDRKTGLYRAKITADRRPHDLGLYATQEDAAAAYAEAAARFHGAFARVG